MSAIEEAIKTAEKGGWKLCEKFVFKKAFPNGNGFVFENESGDWVQIAKWQEICFDPLFWQCLGKARGWGRRTYRQSTPRCIRMMTKPTPNRWKKEWHRLIDHRAEGKDAESFFASLV